MAVKFNNRVKIAPGVKVNVGLKGVSTTIGPKGASVNIGKKGVYANASLPGTGLSSRTKISDKQGAPSTSGAKLSTVLIVAAVAILVVALVIWLG